MNSNLKIFLIALITIGCIYFLFFNKPKYSFTIPPTTLTVFRAQCSGLVAPDPPWPAPDYCTIVACHDDNNDEKSCGEIEQLLKVANDQQGENDLMPFGLTMPLGYYAVAPTCTRLHTFKIHI
jgi:hypothetical protein